MKKGNKPSRRSIILASVIAFVVVAVCVLAIVDSNSKNSSSSKLSTDTTVEAPNLVAAPDDYIGTSIKFVGKIFKLEGSAGDYTLQVYSNPKNSDGNIIVFSDSNEKFAEDDFVEITGVVGSSFEGENAFGAKITAPTVNAVTIKTVPADMAIAPTLTEKTPGLQKQIGGLTVTLEKVEYAENETRIVLKYDNKGTTDFSAYSFEANLIQDRKKIETISDYQRTTYDSDSDILAGTTKESKLYYGKLDTGKPATYSFKVTNNDTYDSTDVVFEIQ